MTNNKIVKENWTSGKSFDSLAKEIWKSRKEYVSYGLFLTSNKDDAEDLFVKTGLYFIKNSTNYNPDLSPLNFYFKDLMKKMRKDLFKHSKDSLVARGQSRYNYTGKDDSFLAPEPKKKKKKRELKSLEIDVNDNQIVFVTTKTPHKVSLDTITFLTGMENISKETKNNFRNKHGDQIKVKKIISEYRFIIQLFFDHEVDENTNLGENIVVGLEDRPPMMKPDEKPVRPHYNSEEEKAISKIQIDECIAKLSSQEKQIFKLNMIPNDQINNSRPMITSRIAEQLNMAAGTVGEILSRAKKSFAKCMMANDCVGA